MPQNNTSCSKTNTAQNPLPCYAALGTWFSNAEEFYFTRLNASKRSFCVVLILIYFSLLLLNFRTPHDGDDYNHSIMPDGKHVATISDAASQVKDNYLYWGGRAVSMILTMSAILAGKPVFDFFNAGAYTLLCLLIYFHTMPKKTNVLLLLGIHFGVWFFAPVFGQTILWVSGTVVYMWGTVLILFFLLPYRWIVERENVSGKHMIWLIPAGVLAGNCGVNVSIAAVILSAAVVVYIWFARRKLPLWAIAGMVSLVIGFAIFYLAPGTTHRANVYQIHSSFVLEMMWRAAVVSHVTFVHSIGLLLIGLLLVSLFTNGEKFRCQQWGVISLFLFASFIASYAMVMSPMIPTPPRAYFGAVIFLLIAVANYFGDIPFDKITAPMRHIVFSLFCGLLLSFPFHYGIALMDLHMTYTVYQQRYAYIEEQKKLGNFDIVCPRATPVTLYNPLYDAPTSPKDIQHNKDHWINRAWAKYHGINSIVPEPR